MGRKVRRVPGCGTIPLVQVVPGFSFDPARAFAHHPQILWRRGEESTVELWHDEVVEHDRSALDAPGLLWYYVA